MTFYILCSRLNDLFVVVSQWLHLGIKKEKRVNTGCGIYVRFELLCTPFAHVIAGSYKKSTAHHCELEMFVCSLCNQTFSTQGSLKRHRESVHWQSPGFSCQVCDQRFYRKDTLQRHMKVYQPAVLFGHSAACAMDAAVDLPLPPPPSPPPKRHDETPVCNLCARSRSTLASWTRRDRGLMERSLTSQMKTDSGDFSML